MNITAITIKRLDPPESGYQLHWDEKLKGFELRDSCRRLKWRQGMEHARVN